MLDYVAIFLSAASMVLHFLAPRTKTKVDDKLADAVDVAQKATSAIKPLVTLKAAPASKPVEGFGVARDHRSK